MPDEVGGAGLDTLTWLLYEKELGRANYALHWTCVARPSNILLAGTPEQREKLPVSLHSRREMGLPGDDRAGRGLGSARHEGDRRGRTDGGDWVLNGTKHFISHADIADFAIVFMASGEEDSRAGQAQEDHRLLRRQGHAGFHRPRRLPQRFASRLHQFRSSNSTIAGCPGSRCSAKSTRVSRSRIPGSGATRLQVAATCLGRAERALGLADRLCSANAQQFGQQIGKFQGVSFKLADMATELKAAELMLFEAGWKYDQGTVTDQDMAMAKLKATEMLAFVADEAIQIHGGMGLMDDLPLERIWRDARVERIWEGTSEIQRHIISRALLRPLGA